MATEVETETKTIEEEDDDIDINVSEPLSPMSPPTIVLDNGGGLLKAGLVSSTHSYDTYCVPSLVGTPKHSRVMLSAPTGSKLFGNVAAKNGGLCKLSYPIQNGIIKNWNDMIQLWQYLYSDILDIDCKEHPLLITEAPKNPISNRIRIAQIHLEYFETPSIYFAPPSVLALYATGRLSGCVLDSGHGVTCCVPMVDGYALPHCITRMDVGGDDITRYFSKILSKIGDYNFQTSAELQSVRIIKEKVCMLNSASVDTLLNPRYHSHGMMASTSNKLLSSKLSTLTGKLGSSFQTLGLSKSRSGGNMANNDDALQYELPDGTILNIGNTHQRAAEILFDPSIIGYTKERGISHLICDAIKKCDVLLRNRLYDSIFCIGGNCNIRHFEQRLMNELKKNVSDRKNNRNLRIRSLEGIVGNKKQKHMVPFVGGSLIAQNEQFKELWITKKEFEEYGVNILFRRSLC